MTYDSKFGIVTVDDFGVENYKVEIIVNDIAKLMKLLERLELDEKNIINEKNMFTY